MALWTHLDEMYDIRSPRRSSKAVCNMNTFGYLVRPMPDAASPTLSVCSLVYSKKHNFIQDFWAAAISHYLALSLTLGRFNLSPPTS